MPSTGGSRRGEGPRDLRSELIFQLSNVTGAVCAVVATPSPRVGFGVVALVLLFGGLGFSSRIRLSIRYEPEASCSVAASGSVMTSLSRCSIRPFTVRSRGITQWQLQLRTPAARIAVTGNGGRVEYS